MQFSRRSDSAFIDLDITDGDALWYCTDRFNATGPTRLGGGRLRLRNVHWQGGTLISHSDIDYALKVSSTLDGNKYWVGNQAGMESDMTQLKVWVNGSEVPMLNPGDTYPGLIKSVRISFRTRFFLDDAAHTAFAENEWTYIWENGVYSFKLSTHFLAPVFKWYEYSSNTPTDGAGGDRNPWKCFRVMAGSTVYNSLGQKDHPSQYYFDSPDETIQMYLIRESDHEGVAIEIKSALPIPLQTLDHASKLVITSHLTHNGARPVQVSSGKAHHKHSITVTSRSDITK